MNYYDGTIGIRVHNIKEVCGREEEGEVREANEVKLRRSKR